MKECTCLLQLLAVRVLAQSGTSMQSESHLSWIDGKVEEESMYVSSGEQRTASAIRPLLTDLRREMKMDLDGKEDYYSLCDI